LRCMEISTSIERYIAAVPKADLHIHLEGSIQPATLLTLAQRNGVQLPVQTKAEMRSIEDPHLMAYLRDQQIPLEVCPTSNIRLGVYANMSSHPFPRLYNAGIPISVNSDDPLLFSTTLNHEVALLFNAFTFDVITANDILLNGVRYSFLPWEEMQAMEAAFQQEMAQLQQASM
jgi:adenosine deaminase